MCELLSFRQVSKCVYNGSMRALFGLLLTVLAGVASAQQPYTEYHDLVYTQASGYPQTLDLYVPSLASGRSRPGIIFVHGGGWAAGDKEDFASWARYYAAQGYVSASINYRLAPQHVWPAQIDDTQAAVRWMRKYAPYLGLNPNKIGAVGASAGGHLALFLGQVDTFNDFDPDLRGYSSRVQAVADFFGPADFSMKSEWTDWVWQLIESFVGGRWMSGPKPFKAASPLTYVTSEDAPTLIFHGSADDIVPVSQSRRIAAKMKSFGVPVDYYEFAGEGHGFTYDTTIFCIQKMDAFFAARLRR